MFEERKINHHIVSLGTDRAKMERIKKQFLLQNNIRKEVKQYIVLSQVFSHLIIYDDKL